MFWIWGAGTVKLTGGLLAAGVEVIAVVPDEEMRAELVRLHPDATALSGAAEAIPLADGSVDAVLAGQAFLVRPTAGFPEIARVLRADGVFAAFWNNDDDKLDYLRATPETAEGEFDFPLRTEVIRAVRRARTPR